jgi:hypothetical protein
MAGKIENYSRILRFSSAPRSHCHSQMSMDVMTMAKKRREEENYGNLWVDNNFFCLKNSLISRFVTVSYDDYFLCAMVFKVVTLRSMHEQHGAPLCN